MKATQIITLALLVTLQIFIHIPVNAADESAVKMYTLDCGSLSVADMKDLSMTGAYDGQSLEMVNPCFLIRHPKGDLLWDTGHVDSLADEPNGNISGVWHSKMSVKLVTQLKQLGLTSADIEYLSLSHIHPDHAGNANEFAQATFIVNQLEREYMFSEPINSYFGQYYSALKEAKAITFTNEHDVFGDKSVVIKSMPGHTPGSSVLLVRLQQAGSILLTGDLYTHARARSQKTMHGYNNKALTLASREKFEQLVTKENAKVIIQHEKADFDSLPKFPKFLN